MVCGVYCRVWFDVLSRWIVFSIMLLIVYTTVSIFIVSDNLVSTCWIFSITCYNENLLQGTQHDEKSILVIPVLGLRKFQYIGTILLVPWNPRPKLTLLQLENVMKWRYPKFHDYKFWVLQILDMYDLNMNWYCSCNICWS